MDSSLLREREQFKKKAFSNPTIEKRKSSTQLDDQRDCKKPKIDESESNGNVTKSLKKFHNFGLLAKTVQYLRKQYLGGQQNPLTLEEILRAVKQSDIDPNVKSWLGNDALKNNPKTQVIESKFLFKPIYKLTDHQSLLNLLRKQEVRGLGGILWEDVVESLPDAENILNTLLRNSKLKIVTRSDDKKKILFRVDTNAILNIDDDFKTLWNTVDVEALDNDKMCDYLSKQGLTSIKGEGFKKPLAAKNNQKDGTRKGKSKKIKDNLHLKGVLESYDHNTLTQKGS